MPRVVVLGTGTDVGKTYVTRALARALHARLPTSAIVPLKPVETGLRRDAVDAVAAGDANALDGVTFNAPRATPHPLYGFRMPVSPQRAAAAEGGIVDLERIAVWVADIENAIQYNTWVVIETAGGVFSPLAPRFTNLELAMRLAPAAWLLVAPDALGVLHDLTATLTAMRARAGRAPDVVVLSAARAVDESTGGNLAECVELGIATPVAALSHDDVDGIELVVDALLAWQAMSR